MTDPRDAAVKAIAAVDAGKTAQEAIVTSDACLEGRDRSLLSDLVYGTLRHRISAQFLLTKVLARPHKLPPTMRIALETAIYSLMHQNKTPDYAAVNETVKLIKKRFGHSLAKVANGALRSLLRLDLSDPNLFGTGATSMAISHSLPRSIYDLWYKAYGEKAAHALLARSCRRPYTGLRINMQKQAGKRLYTALMETPGSQGIARSGIAFGPGQLPGQILGKGLMDWEQQGLLSFQASASMLVLEKLDIPSDIPLWDACAGVGGKALALLEAGYTVPLASDTSLKRLGRLPEQCRRLGLPLPKLFLANAACPPLNKWHGNILADVPCSGLGVLGRRPDIKSRWNPDEARKLIELQEHILSSLASLLQPGRELFYITCTLNPAENDEQIKKLLASCKQLKVMKTWQTPHEHPWLEGMFVAKIRKD